MSADQLADAPENLRTLAEVLEANLLVPAPGVHLPPAKGAAADLRRWADAIEQERQASTTVDAWKVYLVVSLIAVGSYGLGFYAAWSTWGAS